MRISDWSSDVCSSDLFIMPAISLAQSSNAQRCLTQAIYYEAATESDAGKAAVAQVILNRKKHTSELQSLMRISYAVFCLKSQNTSSFLFFSFLLLFFSFSSSSLILSLSFLFFFILFFS